MASAGLTALLQELSRLHNEGPIMVGTGDARDEYEVMLFPPARESDLTSLQLVLGKRLPPDFVAFLRATNGANLYVNDSGLHGVGLASVGLLAELQSEEEEIYGAEALAPYIVFGRMNGSGDFLVFEQETGRVLDGVHAEQPHEWRVIADNFAAWLARLIAAEGRYYWLEALYDAPGDQRRPHDG